MPNGEAINTSSETSLTSEGHVLPSKRIPTRRKFLKVVAGIAGTGLATRRNNTQPPVGGEVLLYEDNELLVAILTEGVSASFQNITYGDQYIKITGPCISINYERLAKRAYPRTPEEITWDSRLSQYAMDTLGIQIYLKRQAGSQGIFAMNTGSDFLRNIRRFQILGDGQFGISLPEHHFVIPIIPPGMVDTKFPHIIKVLDGLNSVIDLRSHVKTLTDGSTMSAGDDNYKYNPGEEICFDVVFRAGGISNIQDRYPSPSGVASFRLQLPSSNELPMWELEIARDPTPLIYDQA
ncbi:hypothetical protein A2982_01955 [candidate division WWE3 bacterium RIFCSPLOWO2_01_FULL_39_13]|uniref:Uncharacterized protein n=1 Tax=candidate division WWE3 bacterium RIFCSPLOWO2_01_FULL_39_13 TaxID=1802624 RepID=A0A1F4V5A2_UNCKA|nr:MAG: hypothetical protein A2982_01955 [candidate division WWE3 bacterium RIFCSPLOWO2_01_FULL_39_13]